MKIKTKLLFINGGLLLSFLLSVALYVIMTLPSIKIEEEKKVLQNLILDFMDYRTAINQIPYAIYTKQKEIVIELGEKSLESFNSISQLENLKKSSDKIAESLIMISKISEIVETSQIDLLSELQIMEEDAVLVFGSTSAFKISDFYTEREAQRFNRIDKIYYHFDNLTSSIKSLDYSIQSSLTIINEQTNVIDKEINNLKRKGLTMTFIIIAGLFACVIVIVIFLSNRIGKSITKIVDKIVKMKDGDLTVRFDDRYKDDIGLLCQDMNSFQENLANSISNIQEISDENITVQNDLIVTVNQTDKTSSQIEKNASEIAGQIDHLKMNVDGSSKAVNQVDNVFNTLNNQVEEQMAMVEESTASVTEMISSIDSIARITETKTAAIDQLVKTSSNGAEKLKDTTSIINLINDKIDNISQMAGVIKGIANQTNLLAMNAAIEAAHAGDSGKGFAVVADEIRKLAEASSKQSNEISSNLKEIVANIEKAQESGNVTNIAYSEVDGEISQFSLSLYEIASSISELKSGGEQILMAMTTLQDVSTNVKNSSNDLSDASTSMKTEMESVKSISEEVHNKIREVSTGIGEVSHSVNSINRLANSVGTVTENLNSELSRFKTETAKEDETLSEFETEPETEEI